MPTGILLLDIMLIGLFATFTYFYFVVSLVVTDGPAEVYNTNLTQTECLQSAGLPLKL